MKSQFDFGTIIGLVAGLFCIFISMIWPEVDRGDIILSTGDSWRFEQLIWFFQPQSVFIVLGGVSSYEEGVQYGYTGGYEQGFQAGRVEGHGDILGCTTPSAVNYNPEATFDDGSCEFAGEGRPGETIDFNPIGGTDKDGELIGGA